MVSEAEYSIKILRLETPVCVAGRSIRVKHGTPECFPAINALCTDFLSEDMPSKIPGKLEPIVRFGICAGHVYYDDIIEFTYTTGVQVTRPQTKPSLPESVALYDIPAGDYACIGVTSPDAGTTIGTAYVKLEQWIADSEEWEPLMPGEIEVYPNVGNNLTMELWRPVRPKNI